MRRQTTTNFAALAGMLLAATFVWIACDEGQDTAATRSSSSRAGARRSRAAEGSVQESVDLASLLSEIPEYRGSGRNLFDFGRLPVVAPPTRETPPPPPPRPPTRRPTAPTTSAPRVDLKFAGYVETKTVGGETKKYAVFLDRSEILTGAEGDLVANRYRIIQIGLESVTVGLPGSNDTQRIPLRSN